MLRPFTPLSPSTSNCTPLDEAENTLFKSLPSFSSTHFNYPHPFISLSAPFELCWSFLLSLSQRNRAAVKHRNISWLTFSQLPPPAPEIHLFWQSCLFSCTLQVWDNNSSLFFYIRQHPFDKSLIRVQSDLNFGKKEAQKQRQRGCRTWAALTAAVCAPAEIYSSNSSGFISSRSIGHPQLEGFWKTEALSQPCPRVSGASRVSFRGKMMHTFSGNIVNYNCECGWWLFRAEGKH